MRAGGIAKIAKMAVIAKIETRLAGSKQLNKESQREAAWKTIWIPRCASE